VLLVVCIFVVISKFWHYFKLQLPVGECVVKDGGCWQTPSNIFANFNSKFYFFQSISSPQYVMTEVQEYRRKRIYVRERIVQLKNTEKSM